MKEKNFNMDSNPESLYRQLGRLIETMPEFPATGNLTLQQHRWLALADALVAYSEDGADKIILRAATGRLQTAGRIWALEDIRNILYRILAAAELQSPASAQGAFIPVGNGFDAFAALSKIIGCAKSDVLLIDPYMDETALTDFGGIVAGGVTLRILADPAYCKPSLDPAANRWVQQYGTTRPLQVRLSPPKALHDRAIFIDNTKAWTLTQSFKDFAKRSPAEIVRADDTAMLKIGAYQAIWDMSGVIV